MRGCRHSFHIECILPDLSVCRICKSTLHDDDDDDEENEDGGGGGGGGGGGDDDDDGNDTYEKQPENSANNRISTLLEQISLWRMPDVPLPINALENSNSLV